MLYQYGVPQAGTGGRAAIAALEKDRMSRFNSEKIRAVFGGRGFYIALALCLTAVGIIGYMALTEEEPPVENVVNPTPVIDKTPVTPPPVVEKIEPEVEVEEEVEPVLQVEELLPQVISPLDGTTVTVFSMTELMYDETMADWRTHDGLDIQAAEGDAVKTAAAGMVLEVKTMN